MLFFFFRRHERPQLVWRWNLLIICFKSGQSFVLNFIIVRMNFRVFLSWIYWRYQLRSIERSLFFSHILDSFNVRSYFEPWPVNVRTSSPLPLTVYLNQKFVTRKVLSSISLTNRSCRIWKNHDFIKGLSCISFLFVASKFFRI